MIAILTFLRVCFNTLDQLTYKCVYFRFEWVVHFNMGTCSRQVVHSFVCLPRTGILRRTAHGIKNSAFKRRCVTAENRRIPATQVKSIVLITFKLCLLLFLWKVFCMCFLFCFFVSGPAHILCLIVASGWNKEWCMPKNWNHFYISLKDPQFDWNTSSFWPACT
jgi:hypothetical protein